MELTKEGVEDGSDILDRGLFRPERVKWWKKRRIEDRKVAKRDSA